jgi:hypothetical protein
MASRVSEALHPPKYVVRVSYPSGDVRYVSQGGALTSDLALARRYKTEKEAKSDAKPLGGFVVSAV